MSPSHRSGPEIRDRTLRLHLAVLSTRTKLLRLDHLLRKYSRDQPRAPAGRTDGGRWIPPGGGQWASLGGPKPSPQEPRRTPLDGGGEVLTVRVRAGRDVWEDRHTVITPEGESRIFETSGDIQTIRDGQTGEVLSRATLSPQSAGSEATVQPAFLPAIPFAVAPAVVATIEAAALLATFLAARSAGFGKEPGSIAMRYDFAPDPGKKFPVVWVGKVDHRKLNDLCPLNPEIQAVTNEATKRLTALNPLLNKTKLGSLIHLDIGHTIQARHYPNVAVEFSLDKNSGKEVFYSELNSVRLDLFELTEDQMVCVYDYKTGKEGLSASRALLLARVAKMYFPTAKGIIMVQMRPQPGKPQP